jgi:hypothetical protein
MCNSNLESFEDWKKNNEQQLDEQILDLAAKFLFDVKENRYMTSETDVETKESTVKTLGTKINEIELMETKQL